MMALEHLATVLERVSLRIKQSLYAQKHMSSEVGAWLLDALKRLATSTKAEGDRIVRF